MPSSKQLSWKKPYQICARRAEGSPVFKNSSLASTPDTNPSMSLSVFTKISSYLILSAGDTIHWREMGMEGERKKNKQQKPQF